MSHLPVSSKIRHLLWMRAGIVAALVLMAACSSHAVRDDAATADVPAMPLQSMMGRWFVIAHIPNFAERGDVASTVSYSLDGDGGIQVVHQMRDGFDEPVETRAGSAEVVPGSGNRLWRVRYYRVIPTRLRILELAPDRSWALLDYPDRDLAWILARKPDMDKAQYREIEGRMKRHGVNTDRLRRVPQLREQVGKLGFAPPSQP